MSRCRRAPNPGAPYFCTLNTYRRQALLTHGELLTGLRSAHRVVRIEHKNFKRPFFIKREDTTEPVRCQTRAISVWNRELSGYSAGSKRQVSGRFGVLGELEPRGGLSAQRAGPGGVFV